MEMNYNSKKRIFLLCSSITILGFLIYLIMRSIIVEDKPEVLPEPVKPEPTKDIQEVPQKTVKNEEVKIYASHDYGKLIEGSFSWHKFQFINNTKKDLKILKTRVPCGCAEIKYDNKVLKPGKIMFFNVAFDSRRYRGKVKKYFYVFTDSPTQPIIKYLMIAEVLPKPAPICFAPNVFKLLIKPGEIIKAKFPIKNEGNRELVIDAKRIPKAVNIKTVLPLKIPPGKYKNLHFTVNFPKESESLRKLLMFKSNDPKRPTVRVVVQGEIKE